MPVKHTEINPKDAESERYVVPFNVIHPNVTVIELDFIFSKEDIIAWLRYGPGIGWNFVKEGAEVREERNSLWCSLTGKLWGMGTRSRGFSPLDSFEFWGATR